MACGNANQATKQRSVQLAFRVSCSMHGLVACRWLGGVVLRRTFSLRPKFLMIAASLFVYRFI